MAVAETWNLPLTEAQFQKQVTDLAEIQGWKWAHFRPAMTKYGWKTPVSGSLGAGFPDLILVRDTEILFVELKAEKSKPTGLQETVLGILSRVALVMVWRPSDWQLIMDILSRRP